MTETTHELESEQAEIAEEAEPVMKLIIRNGNRVFATQRGYGDYKDGWEFPGGKIEQGETPQEALAREIKEELDTWLLESTPQNSENARLSMTSATVPSSARL